MNRRARLNSASRRFMGGVFLSVIFFLQTGPPSRACGPWLTETILDVSFAILRAPKTSFHMEMTRIKLDIELPGKLTMPEEIHPHDPYVKDETIALLFTSSGQDLIADRDGCRTTLLESNSDLARDIAEVATFLKDGDEVEKYRAIRTVMLPGKKDLKGKLKQEEIFTADKVVKNRNWPDFLPEEFHLYLDGADDFSQQKLDDAAVSYEKLLGLPVEERLYRSTWAAYMRARVELKKGDVDLKSSIVHFQSVLGAREDGCHDSLKLGWDALRCVADHLAIQGERGTALRYYFALAWRGRGPVAPLRSLNWMLRKPGDAEMEMARNDSFVRQLYTARGVNRVNEVEYWKEGTSAESDEWLGFLHEIELIPREAGSAAHFAYRLGDLKSTETFLKTAPAMDTTAIWLRGKLLAKAGQVRSASRELAKAKSVPSYERTMTGRIPEFLDQPGRMEPQVDHIEFRAGQLHADQAILHLANDRYEEAMVTFVKAGYWRDAAYIAEQLLSREELLAFVRDRWPTHDSSIKETKNYRAYSLRYLTARRLARERYFKDARGLFPPELVPVFDKYVQNYRLFRDESKPETDRAAAGWEAAQIHRRLGMELFGTEVAPDFTCWDGIFDYGADLQLERLKLPGYPRIAERAPHYRNPVKPKLGKLNERQQKRLQQHLDIPVFPEPTSSEKWRWKHYAILPNENRFHYRHVAADLAWEASQLMPGETDETAQLLNIAGSWLSSKHPKKADVFYKAMVRRNRSTPTGHHADQSRWFVHHDWWAEYNPWKSMWLPTPERRDFLVPQELAEYR